MEGAGLGETPIFPFWFLNRNKVGCFCSLSPGPSPGHQVFIGAPNDVPASRCDTRKIEARDPQPSRLQSRQREAVEMGTRRWGSSGAKGDVWEESQERGPQGKAERAGLGKPEHPRGLHAVRPSVPSRRGAGHCQGSGSLWEAHSNSVSLFSWKQDWTWTWVICSQRLTG